MTLVAGIDIGNATTEIVFARLEDGVLSPVLAEQVPTRGAKGSSTSITAAAALVRRMSDRVGESPTHGAVARLTPVHTGVISGTGAGADTGRLAVVPIDGRTLVHAGAAVGRGVWLEALAGGGGAGGGRPFPRGRGGAPAGGAVPPPAGGGARGP